MPPFPAPHLKPTPWLTELARTKPAKWQWNRALRAGLCIGLPLGVGMLSGQMALGVWMSIASLMLTSGESNASYHSRLKAIAISSGLGSLGCLVGYAGVLPWGWIVPLMAVLAVLAGIVSSYGAPFSAGMLQFLALATVAIGRPQIGPFWEPMLYFIIGAFFYALMMLLEGALLRLQPRRQMAADLVKALAQLALNRAAGLQTGTEANHTLVEDSRRAVTALQSALYADVLGRHARKAGRTSEVDSIWALLQSSDDAFAAILSAESAPQLKAAAADLETIASMLLSGKKPSSQLKLASTADNASPLARAIIAMASARRWSHSPFSRIVAAGTNKPASRKPRFDILCDRLLPGTETLRSALALGLCVAVSYAAHWVDKDVRWYWIPLTVAIIMKPDFGSIFARSLARTAGTLVGAVVGTVIMILLPKGIGLVAMIAILAALIPWAAQRSYATLAIIITPLVLVLIDLTVPGTINVNYGGQRLLGTAIGAGIVLVFGYFIWPRTHSKAISANFQQANGALAAYLLAAAHIPPANGAQPSLPLPRLRRIAYAKLTDLRTQLQKTMAEPPPAGAEATAWLPIVASAERICDSITAYSVRAEPTGSETSTERTSDTETKPEAGAATAELIKTETATTATELVRRLAGEIAIAPASQADKDWQAACATLPAATVELIHGVVDELRFIHRSIESTAATPSLPQPATTTASA